MSNLLSSKEKKEIVSLYRRRFMSVALSFFAGLCLIGSLLLFPALIYVKSNQTILTARKNSFAGRETSGLQGSLTKALTDINTRLGVFPDSAPASPIVHSFIDPVLSAKTSSIRITDFSFAGGTNNATQANVQVSGVATSREALLTFSKDLGKIAGVSNVTVPITSFIKDTNVMFTVSATIALR
jgi:hypothetical protein